MEFLGDRLVNLITALIVEEVKIDKCHHTVRLIERVIVFGAYVLMKCDSHRRQFAPSSVIMTRLAGFPITSSWTGALRFHLRIEKRWRGGTI